MASVGDIFQTQTSFEEELSLSDTENISLIKNYIKNIAECNLIIDDFGEGLEWLNSDRPLTLRSSLKGRIVVLDFFTYCCINCHHVLPQLKELEERFHDKVVVVGVHSSKFENERSRVNVANAILRHNITHLVVNDPEAILWNRLQIQCWPTLVILGPAGQILFSLVGENHRDELFRYVEASLDYYNCQSQIDTSFQIPLRSIKDSLSQKKFLQFPGKICTDSESGDIFISDSGNNRILHLSSEGVVKDFIGSGQPGSADGFYNYASFYNPQGLICFNSQQLFVADTGNHKIRKIDLDKKTVETIAGTGCQGQDKDGGNPGLLQEICSPWDVCLAPPIGQPASPEKNVLYIAMAGIHQIWAYILQDTTWKGGRVLKAKTCFCVAGSGNEENRNNCYPQRAGFSQPSGITLVAFGHPSSFICVVDSESSCIRSLSLQDGAVKSLVGGDRNPMNLFAFGDEDGTGLEAKLQHPLGACFHPEKNVIYIADTYNHKIKTVDPTSKDCQTLQLRSTNLLNEPGGICLHGNTLYIADTNNHSIKRLALDTLDLLEFPIHSLPSGNTPSCQDTIDGRKNPASQTDLEFNVSPVDLNPGGQLKLALTIQLEPGTEFTEGAPQRWELLIPETSQIQCLSTSKGSLTINDDTNTATCEIILEAHAQISLQTETNSSYPVTVKFNLFICHKAMGLCFSRIAIWNTIVKLKDQEKRPDQASVVQLFWKVGI